MINNLEDIPLEDREYVLNLPNHLLTGEMTDDLCKILMEFDFLNYKVSASALQLLIEDYNFIKKSKFKLSEKQVKTLQLIQRTLQQSSRILQKDQTQLAEQLFGRLFIQENDYIKTLLTQAKASKATSWLCSIKPSLTSSKDSLVRILEGHTQIITDCALSDDGKIGLSGSRDCTLRVWDLEKGTCEHILTGHKSQINACSLSGDGKIALSCSDDRTLRLWNTKTGECLRILKGHTKKVKDCALNQDGKIALSASDDGTAKIWDVKIGECLLTFDEHQDCVTCCDFSRDGKKALSGSYDQTLKLWNTETGECLSTIENELGAFICCSLSGDGHLALTISEVMVLEDDTNSSNEIVISSFPGKIDDDPSSVKFADFNDLSDEQQKDWSQYVLYMLQCSGLSLDMLEENRLVRLWDLETCHCRHVFQEESFTSKCKLTEDGRVALSSTIEGGKIKVWNATTGKHINTLSTSSTYVSALAINKESRKNKLSHPGDLTLDPAKQEQVSYCYATSKRSCFALSASDNGDIRLWNIEQAINASKENLPSSKGEFISGCGYNQKGNKAFSMSSSGIIEIWNTRTSFCTKKVKFHSTLSLECSISSILEIGLIERIDDMLSNLYLIDLNSGKCLLVLNEHSSQISNFALSENGEMIISASQSELHLIRIEKQKYKYMVLEDYSETTEELVSCDLNADGLIILTAYDNGILRIRDLRKESFIEIKSGHQDKITKCAISSNGMTAISSSKDKFLKIWDITTGDCIDTLLCDSDLHQHRFIISNDSQLLLYSQTRDTIQIVNISNGQKIGKFAFDSWVSALAFSPDSTQIMVGDYSGCVHFLQLEGLNTSENQLL